MRITAKLVAAIIFGFLVILIVDGYISIQREIVLFHENKEKKAKQFGFGLKGLISEVWRVSGREQALMLIKDATVGEDFFRIRWIWLGPEIDQLGGVSIDPPVKARLKKGLEASLEIEDETGTNRLYTFIPMTVDENRLGALEISESLADLKRYTRITVYKTIAVIGATVLVSGFLFGLFSFWLIGHPLWKLNAKINQISNGDLTTRIEIKKRDELSELGTTLNMLSENLLHAREDARKQNQERMKTMEQLRHVDRLKTIGVLASGIAHELGTPLNVISGRAELIISRQPPDDQITHSATIIKDQTKRMTAIIKQLLDYARNDSPRKSLLNLRLFVNQTLELLEPMANKNGIRFEVNCKEPDLKATFDAGQIQQVMTNLLTNAINAMPQGGKIEIGISQEYRSHADHPDGEAASYAAIYVKDQGPGIPKEIQSRIFEPFFTTKEPGKGTGLGLSIAQSIVNEHGGWIDVLSENGSGSCLKFFINQGCET